MIRANPKSHSFTYRKRTNKDLRLFSGFPFFRRSEKHKIKCVSHDAAMLIWAEWSLGLYIFNTIDLYHGAAMLIWAEWSLGLYIFNTIDLYHGAAMLIFFNLNQYNQTEAWRKRSLVPFSVQWILAYITVIGYREHDHDGGNSPVGNPPLMKEEHFLV